MSNYTAKIQQQKASLEKMKEARSKAEATKEQLEQREDQLVKEVRGLGVEPKQLEGKLEELDTSVKSNLARVDELIPEKFRVATR